MTNPVLCNPPSCRSIPPPPHPTQKSSEYLGPPIKGQKRLRLNLSQIRKMMVPQMANTKIYGHQTRWCCLCYFLGPLAGNIYMRVSTTWTYPPIFVFFCWPGAFLFLIQVVISIHLSLSLCASHTHNSQGGYTEAPVISSIYPGDEKTSS